MTTTDGNTTNLSTSYLAIYLSRRPVSKGKMCKTQFEVLSPKSWRITLARYLSKFNDVEKSLAGTHMFRLVCSDLYLCVLLLWFFAFVLGCYLPVFVLAVCFCACLFFVLWKAATKHLHIIKPLTQTLTLHTHTHTHTHTYTHMHASTHIHVIRMRTLTRARMH